jgi:hypothetical protein
VVVAATGHDNAYFPFYNWVTMKTTIAIDNAAL